jgi:two-component system, NarL family, response regulator NreC
VADRYYVSPSMASGIIRDHTAARHGARLTTLTPQERAVLTRVSQHKSSKEIASELRIAPRTVDTHRLSICKKLGVHGNYGLTRFAARSRGEH